MKKVTYTIFICFATLFLGTNIWCQPLTMIVNSPGDGSDVLLGDGVCEVTSGAGDCTLRAAIEEANNNTGFHDIINFGIPGGGVHTIMPGITGAIPPVVGLPILSDNAGVTIDGYTQPSAAPGTSPPSTANLLIEIKGQGIMLPFAPLMHGIWIKSDGNIIKGLIINEFTGDGVRIEGTPDTSSNNLVYANFIGTDAAGNLDLGNATISSTTQWWAGVSIIVPPCDENPVYTRNNIVRRNLISGNGTFIITVPPPLGEGVSITNCPPGDNGFNTVDYNYIGTDKSGMLGLGNDSDGVTIAEAAHDNLIDNNVISDNGYSGVGINGLQPDPSYAARYTINNTVSNNIIGLDVTSSNALANGFQGVSIGRFGPTTWGYARSNKVNNNTIAFNKMNGVLVDEHQTDNSNCDFNLISQNSIYSNVQLGIDLVTPSAGPGGVVTLNDPGDPDNGPNQEINFPVITSAIIGTGNTVISGTVDVPTPATSIVEVFKAVTDPTGYGEGITYIGNTTPSIAGNWTLTTTIPINTSDMLTATTTDANNNSSEFSLNTTPVLPVHLLTWEASIEGPNVILSWTTASEVKNRGFEIMKSRDLINWKDITWIPGRGNSSEFHTYSYVDRYPYLGDNYYQLVQKDFNGGLNYSEIQHIHFNHDNSVKVRVYPNPSSGIFEIEVLNSDNLPFSIRIYDIVGRLYWSKNFENEEFDKSWKERLFLPMCQVYLIQVQIGNKAINKRMVVTSW